MRNKKIIWIVAGVVGALFVLILLLGLYFSGKIKEQIRDTLTASEEIDVDIFQQNIHVQRPEFRQQHTIFTASKVSLKGLDYWSYIRNNRLIIDKIEIHSPEIVMKKSSEEEEQAQDPGEKRDILVKQLNAFNGIYRLQHNDSAGNAVFLRFPELKFSGIKIDSATRRKGLPFEYEAYSFKGDSLRATMNAEHFIAAEEFSIQNGNTSITSFKIQSYLDKTEFDRSIPYEKDRISLTVENITMDSLQFSLKRDTLFLKNPSLAITGADLEIYRNKLLPDDPRTKTLFSEKMRESPVKFNFKQVKVAGSKIQYEEKVKETGPPAKVIFTDIEGTVENLVNTHMNREDFPRTTVKAGALFMGGTSVTVDWSFNATNHNNKFLISGKFATVPGELMNPLLKPSLGVEAEGALESASFTFTGNEDAAVGDVRVIYDRFKINVMQDEGRKKNKLLSALANLFVDNTGLSEQRTHNVEFTRDKNKSFWNYVWKGLKKGVIDALGQL